MLIEIRINMVFAVGAILNIGHGEDVLHLWSKNGYCMFFYQHVTPTGYITKMFL